MDPQDPPNNYVVTDTRTGQWLQWQEVPMLHGKSIRVGLRYASAVNGSLHIVVDGAAYPPVALPATGSLANYVSVDSGSVFNLVGDTHTVRIVFDSAGVNLNWWQIQTP